MTAVTFEGWLIVREGLLPERWRDRASAAHVVPLLASESDDLLRAIAAVPADLDERLVRLVVSGATDQEIARELALSMRSVERRIAHLRRRFGVTSKNELRRVLTDLGFGRPANPANE